MDPPQDQPVENVSPRHGASLGPTGASGAEPPPGSGRYGGRAADDDTTPVDELDAAHASDAHPQQMQQQTETAVEQARRDMYLWHGDREGPDPDPELEYERWESSRQRGKRPKFSVLVGET